MRYPLLLETENLGIAGLGVGIAVVDVCKKSPRRRYSNPRCRHSNPRCRYNSSRCRHSYPRCRCSNPDETGEGGGGLQGKRGLAISHVSCLNSGWSAREFGDTRSHKERTSPPRPTPGMGQGGAM